ncbi:MAG TPA: hypothetical protein VNK52_10990 [Hyphomicrobiaceae bacterium]|nr:hypothetical protein [Hyphomicrobiaceae bacterium]
MSIETLHNAAIAAGYAMAPSEELLQDNPPSRLPEASARCEPAAVAADTPPERSGRILRPRWQPALVDWLAFWRVPA